MADVVGGWNDRLRRRLASGASPATCNRYVAALSHLFTVAVYEWEAVPVHPVRGVRRLREPAGRVRYLTPDEIARLLAECKASESRDMYDIVVLALYTGMRRGEVLDLEWREVDLERGVITVTASRTKTGVSRTVPLVGAAADVLRFRTLIHEGRVFPIHGVRTSWESAVRRAGLENFRFHDLRHCTASYLAMTGASTLEIAEVLGHRTLAMVRRYAHLDTGRITISLHRAVAAFAIQK